MQVKVGELVIQLHVESCSKHNESMIPQKKDIFGIRCRCHAKQISYIGVLSLEYAEYHLVRQSWQDFLYVLFMPSAFERMIQFDRSFLLRIVYVKSGQKEARRFVGLRPIP